MSNHQLFSLALKDIEKNPEQINAVQELGNCVVLAGPGSGKTKTLNIAMARSLLEDVKEPRGIACITYNNECALELENRLRKLGIERSDRIFIGTVHSFALTQVIYPYARCVLPEIGSDISVATPQECRSTVVKAYDQVIRGGENPHSRWRFAQEKRRKDVDRNSPNWMGSNPLLAQFIEAYEAELRRQKLIDFDDMPLLAVRMVRENEWIRESLKSKYPVLFVDEYQDLGYALHELVLLLCFQAGVRLFAVGDPDQSIYAFIGANPELLKDLTKKSDTKTISLRFNYRCGTNIIEASKTALGESRDYLAPDGAAEGIINFHPVDGELAAQARFVFDQILPSVRNRGVLDENIAILYRTADQGNEIAEAASGHGIPIVRADNQALVKRSCRLSRFIEACARWVSGGWKDADPPFQRLVKEANSLVLGGGAKREERRIVEEELISFLKTNLGADHSAHTWLTNLREELILRWKDRARTITENWDVIDEMIRKTDPASGDGDMPLDHLGGRIEGRGRLNLSTLHSAKGREFEVVVLFGMSRDVIPNHYEQGNAKKIKEVRRLFYVGVTRAQKELHLVFKLNHHSPLVKELMDKVA